MYKQQADNADPQFFPIQKNTLFQWHLADPADSLELVRNDKIAFYQGGKKNPFILDSSLVRRGYFTNTQSINDERGNIYGFELLQNYPNPFNPGTIISYRLPKSSKVELTIYNMLGQKITKLINKTQSAGEHLAIWDGRDTSGELVSSGIYIYRLKAREFVENRKMVLVR